MIVIMSTLFSLLLIELYRIEMRFLASERERLSLLIELYRIEINDFFAVPKEGMLLIELYRIEMIHEIFRICSKGFF